MTAERQRHLVSVWNPAYSANAMEEHLRLLLAHASRRGADDAGDEVYVWWGKVRSSNRQQRLAHLDEILQLDRELAGDEDGKREMHLYLTDYRSLYVGHVGSVTSDDVSRDEHTPAYYRDGGLSCDCWFQLWDIRRLVADDTPQVVAELKKLRNTRYADRPVSIYGGMVDLPLIVTREDGARWFDPATLEAETGGRYWVQHDAERSGIGLMERELRENLFGDEAWSGFDPAVRTFVATAEKVFRDHRSDLGFDFTTALVDLAKAFEVQTNWILRAAVSKMPPAARRVNVEGESRDIAAGRPLTLGQLARVIGEERALNETVRQRLENGQWFAASLPPILRELADVRNEAAHEKRIDRDTAVRLRNRIVGVGCAGTLVELARCVPRR